jgi:uncharacterized protein (UPF0548 family)
MRDHLVVSVEPMNDRRVAELRAARLTYCEVGATEQSVFPVGYRSFQRSVTLPVSVNFDSARRDLWTWMVQSRAGIRVAASGDVVPDAVVGLRLGLGRLSVIAPCRVVYVIDEPARCGFGYGTLSGHPESGEEAFRLTQSVDGGITFTIAAFSRSATALFRLAGPVGHRIQDLMTRRYLRAFG